MALLAGTAAFALLLVVLLPAVASAAPAPPVPATAPSTDTPTPTGPTPNAQPGPSPVPPGQEAPVTPAPSGGGVTPAPDAPDTPPDDTNTDTDSGGAGGPAEPCPADTADCSTAAEVPPPPTPAPQTTPAAPDTSGDGGGIVGWITDAINDAITAFFRALVTAALNPLLDLLGRTLLTTPELSELPAIGELWSTSWAISVTAYGTLIMFGGITVMALGTVQSRISVKEVLPRIPIGFLAAGLSQFLATKAIQIANVLPGAILSDGLDPDAAAEQLKTIILAAIVPTPGGVGKSIFVIFLGLFLAGSVVALLCTYIARVVIEVALIGAAPLALAGHGHPLTEKVAFWWWRAFFGCLGIQIAQSFVLIASFKVFFTPGGFTMFGPTPDGVVNLLAAITLIYFLFKIPFWLMPRIGHGGGGILGRVVRAYVMGRALGFLGGRGRRGAGRVGGRTGRGRGGRGRGGGGGRGRPRRGGPGGGRGGGSPSPYAHVGATATGQLMLPLTQVPRVRRPGTARGVPRPPRQAGPAGRARPRHRQLTIPFGQAVAPGGRYLPHGGGAWANRDGQLLLPFEVDQPRSPTAAPQPMRRPASARAGAGRRSGPGRPTPSRPAPPRAWQPELPFDPYRGIRPDRTGQYALPLEGLHRTPRPARPAPAPVASRPSLPARPVPPRYRQQMLPHMPRRPRQSRNGSDQPQ
ncbi:hypothetical protein [Frankia sp. CcI49]|uniref:hypothetical protein n=1 Tax=Frankia sp. CcI49 TaxID=1745382 RepID=UPI001F517081|nr:hypothetical protein [Frankia sp. CcI49]